MWIPFSLGKFNKDLIQVSDILQKNNIESRSSHAHISFQQLVVNVAKSGRLGFSISVSKNCGQLVDRLYKTYFPFHILKFYFVYVIHCTNSIEFFFAMSFADFTETKMASYWKECSK